MKQFEQNRNDSWIV